MRKILRPSKRMLAVIVLVVAVAGFLTGAYAFHLFGTGTDCWVRPKGPLGSAVFTVVMADEGLNVGYNGSKYQASPWPVISVTVNTTVIIHIINNDTEAHGFQIVHYFDQGIGGTAGLAPGQCFDVRFAADQAGSFAVRCNIFCAIHQYMLSGVLNVNS